MNSGDGPECQRVKNRIGESLKSTEKAFLGLGRIEAVGGLLQKYCRRGEAEKEEGEEGEDDAHVEEEQISRTTNLEKKFKKERSSVRLLGSNLFRSKKTVFKDPLCDPKM